MGSMGMVLNYTFLFGAILLIGALSGYLSEKTGIINIGIDGMMCVGAVFFAIFSAPIMGMSQAGPATILIPLLMSMIATSIMGVIHAFATINLKANHIISGTAINLIGVALATFVNLPLGDLLYSGATRLQSGYTDFLYMGGSFYGSSLIMFGLAIVLAIGLYCIMHYTKVGLRYRAVGENPNAVDTQGINVVKYQWWGVIISSMFAGLAGAIFMFNVKQFGGNTQSTGFLALAIMIAGAWKIPWIGIVSVCFALFQGLSYTSVLTNLQIPREVAMAIPYIVTLLVLMVFSRQVHPPAHSGIPFNKSKR